MKHKTTNSACTPIVSLGDAAKKVLDELRVGKPMQFQGKCTDCEGCGRLTVWGRYADDMPAIYVQECPSDVPEQKYLKEDDRPGVAYVCPTCFGTGEKIYNACHPDHHRIGEMRQHYYQRCAEKHEGYPYWLREFQG